MEALNDWLRTVRADGMVLVRTRVAGPWGFAVDQRDAAVFHFVAEGKAFVRQAGAETFTLGAGDLVLLPRGAAHELVHTPRGKTMTQAEFMALRDGVIDTSEQATTLVCGEFALDGHLFLPAMRALPAAVHLRAGGGAKSAGDAGGSALADTLRLLRDEVETPHFGNQIVVRNLLSTLFVYFMRDWARTTADACTGQAVGNWFSALQSPAMARALACMHEAPERAWTLESLASEAGLSRAAFARQFGASVGEPPHAYLTRWRMGMAARLLQETPLRLAEIAARVGYQSEFAFSRAFKAARGIAPSQFRRLAA